MSSSTSPPKSKVLIVDDDRDIAELVQTLLTDEGFDAVVLSDLGSDVIRAAVGQVEPDCILLDSEGSHEYGHAWLDAAWVRARDRPVPVIMFSAHGTAVREAREGTSPRSQAAGFAAIIGKPFDIDELLEMIGRCVGAMMPFNHSPEAESKRTQALTDRLVARGARNIRTSTQREWATFHSQDGTFVQLYWSQQEGAYLVVRLSQSRERMETVGNFFDLDTAITTALGERTNP